ncbi:hypothetical protein LINPERHAP1_LOCUS27696 [Linum perenne]
MVVLLPPSLLTSECVRL